VRRPPVDLDDQLRPPALADDHPPAGRLADDRDVGPHAARHLDGGEALDHLLRDRGRDDHAAGSRRRRGGAVDERGQRALHVDGAAPEEAAVAQLARRVGRPGLGIGDADGVHVGVEQHARAGPGVEHSDDVPQRVDLDGVPEPLELGAHQRRDGALLAGRAGRADEREEEALEGVAVVLHAAS
jgi:hypothetical protein